MLRIMIVLCAVMFSMVFAACETQTVRPGVDAAEAAADESNDESADESTDSVTDDVTDETSDEVVDEASDAVIDESVDEESDETDSDIDEVIEGWEQLSTTSGVEQTGPATCGIYKSYIYCWGNNEMGIFGNGTVENSNRPVISGGGADGWKLIDLSNVGACALDTAGLIYCWGDNYSKWMTDEDGDLSILTPMLMSEKKFIDMRSGSSNVCGLTETGEEWCRDRNNKVMTRVATGITGYWPEIEGINVSYFSRNHAVGLTPYGSIVVKESADAWMEFYEPIPDINIELVKIDAISASGYGSDGIYCSVNTLKELYCWSTYEKTVPILGEEEKQIVTADLRYIKKMQNVIDVALFNLTACAITTDKRLFCWGANDTGQTGIGYASEEPVDPPVEINLF